MQGNFLFLALVGVAIGVGVTLYIFWRKRHVDNQGLTKGVAKNPQEVKSNNQPDQ